MTELRVVQEIEALKDDFERLRTGEAPMIDLYGWIDAGETWTYVGSTTVKIDGDKTEKYSPGMKVRFVQSANIKYAYIVDASYPSPDSPDTTLTLLGDEVANAAITSPYYSMMDNPVNFPHRFVYTPTWTAPTTNPDIGNGTLAGRYVIRGGLIKGFINMTAGSGTTFGSGFWRFGVPIQSALNGIVAGSAMVLDKSASRRMAGCCNVNKDVDFINVIFVTDAAGNNGVGLSAISPFTWASGDWVRINFDYPII